MSNQNEHEDDERDDDEDCGSCENCGCNLTIDDIDALCEQCEYWREMA